MITAEIRPLPIPLFQELEEPLHAGQEYAFAIDVLSASSGRNILLLEAWGENDACELDHLLAATEVIEDGDWRTVCLRFVPDRDYTQLGLRAGERFRQR